MTAAHAAGDPEVATAYYFDGGTLAGKTFGGFKPQASLGYMSEWGLATHVADLMAIFSRIPGDHRAHVFLLGHSLGGAFVEAFGAWRFPDGSRGADVVAGLILMDGALQLSPITQDAYETTGTGNALTGTPGLSSIRATDRYYALPFLGLQSYVLSEIIALRALATPGAVVADANRDAAFQFLLSLPAGGIPKMTNRAALGFAFNVGYNPLTFITASLGQPDGGSIGSYTGLGGTLSHPTDPTATYDWVDALSATPPGFTPLNNLALAYSFDGMNFPEWYFPQRLPLDLQAVGGGAVADGGYQATNGLLVFDGPLNDAPVLAISGVFFSPAAYGVVQARLGPTIGPGRPNAGASRSSDAGYRLVDGSPLSHVDLLTAAEGPRNPVPDAITQFLKDQGATDTITVQLVP